MSPAAHADTPAQPAPGWRQRWLRRWLARQPALDRLRLEHRHLYVLPTRPGAMLLLTLLLLLVGSINFQLNLGYALTFLVTGSAAAAVWSAHTNLRGLQLSLGAAPAMWAGQPAMLPVQVMPGPRARWALELRVAGSDTPAMLDAEGGVVAQATVPWTPPRRGRLPAPVLEIATRYPLGLCRVWAWWRPRGTLLVYPSPEPDAPPPPWAGHAIDEGSLGPSSGRSGDEPADEVRAWRDGDLPRRVLWKKAAGLPSDDPRQWWVRASPPERLHADCWLDERDCRLHDVEAVRARLCAWVLQADAQGRRYGLRVAGVEIAPDRGTAHRLRCLEVLACH